MAETENVWRKRESILLPCPSGSKPTVRRASPGVMLKAGKVARIFQRQKQETAGSIDQQLAFLETLNDEELAAVYLYARVIICDVVQTPVLSLNPKEGQLSPDDLPPNDFWFIFSWAQNGGPTLPVKLTEGETTVETVGNFPEEQGPGSLVDQDSSAIS